MSFNSLEYLVLLGTTLALYFAAPAPARMWVLIGASVLFYAAWSLPFVALIVLSAGIDYTAGRLMGHFAGQARVRKLLLVLSLTANLAILGYFKYSNFFLETVTEALGRSEGYSFLHVILPPGISFYTFQSMSYTIDVYRGQIAPARSFARFFLYVAFFPQLVAGPIERAGHLLTQFQVALPNRFSAANLVTGLRLVIWGLFKKMVIADPVGFIVDAYFAQPHLHDGTSGLLAAYGFFIQVYCDFSAYSTIARGSARMFGIDLMENFDRPILAVSTPDFWRRWHISLSTWFRDYFYIPLGGNRRGFGRTLLNLFLTAAVSGLWHGAAWNFVLWGVYHGVLLVAAAILLRLRPFAWLVRQMGATAGFAGWFLQFQLTSLSFVIFRSLSVENIGHSYVEIGRALAAGLPMGPWEALFLLFVYGFAGASYMERRFRVFERVHAHSGASAVAYGVFVIVILLFGNLDEQPFIYFQF